MLSIHDLQELSKVDIKDINPVNLKELTDIKINTSDTIEERIQNFFDGIQNPYCFLVNGTPVQISFHNHNKTLDECLLQYLTNKKSSDDSIL